MIGRDALSQDLPLYLPGLSSTLSFASLSVRSPFLGLLETHFLKLDSSALRPALKAIILALLPGLEEETSEDFERTLKLVDGFKSATRLGFQSGKESKSDSGDEYFWQCFFLASITSNSRRLGALAYLVRNLPRLGPSIQQRRDSTPNTSNNGGDHIDAEQPFDEAAIVVTSPEPGLLIRCFAAGLADEQLLIQRGFLDLLVTHLPLHANVLQERVKSEDLELLISSASSVVARREMSLNRRLWSWLLGPEPTSGADGTESPTSLSTDPMNSSLSSRTRYFEDYGLHPLTRAILKLIDRQHESPAERARPFRICLSLMDRWEIGGLVVPEIFLPAVNSVRKYQEQAVTTEDFKEVLRSASVFFDGVESGLIWGEINGLIVTALRLGTSNNDALDKLALAKFIIAHFNVREEEMLLIHAPLTLLTVAVKLRVDPVEQTKLVSLHVDILQAAVSIAMDLVELIPERAYLSRPATSQSALPASQDTTWKIDNGQIIDRLRIFYVQNRGNLDVASPPFSALEVCQLLAREVAAIASKSLESATSGAHIAAELRLLGTLISKAPKVNNLDMKSLLSSVHVALSSNGRPSFSTFASVLNLVITLFHRDYASPRDISSLIDPLVRIAWAYLTPSYPKYHVEAARALWSLQMSLSMDNHEIEASLCRLVTGADVSGIFSHRPADPGRRFIILWTHMLQEGGSLGRRGSRPSIVDTKSASNIGTYEVMLGRPLFLLLDSLLDEKTQLFTTTRNWLQNLSGGDRLFHIFAARFSGFSFLRITPTMDVDGNATDSYTEENDIDQCLYYLQTLSNVLRWSSDSTFTILARKTISGETSYGLIPDTSDQEDQFSLQELFIHVCLRALEYRIKQTGSDVEVRVCQLHRTALSILHQLISSLNASLITKWDLETKLIGFLLVSLERPDPSIQVSLLDVILATLKLKATPPVAIRPASPAIPKRPSFQDISPGTSSAFNSERHESDTAISPPLPPASLIKCFQAGFEAPSSRLVLDSWVTVLSQCLPLYSESIFQVLIPLIETLCTQVGKEFDSLKLMFQDTSATRHDAAPESTLISLLNGLENVLARGHARLVRKESRTSSLRSPDQHGFFGTMVSGVFSSDASQTRSLTANDRLTVLLSFQDAVRICFKIWSWGGLGAEYSNQDPESAASFSYTSLRMRNRARRLLEHLFAAEPLECLETVIEIWQRASINIEDYKYTAVFNLLHVLDGSKPKHTIPAIFDAIYSRTNPSALEPSRKSTLTSTLLDTDLVVFLVEYARSLEDDTMDEIWTDCMTFLKDILTNPFPHRQILPSLLEFAAILGEKVDNTNFGEQRKMRKELGVYSTSHLFQYIRLIYTRIFFFVF